MKARAYDTGALLMLNAERIELDERAIDDVKRKAAESCIMAKAGTIMHFIEENMFACAFYSFRSTNYLSNCNFCNCDNKVITTTSRDFGCRVGT